MKTYSINKQATPHSRKYGAGARFPQIWNIAKVSMPGILPEDELLSIISAAQKLAGYQERKTNHAQSALRWMKREGVLTEI